MSHVADIVLLTSLWDGADYTYENFNADKLSEWLAEHHNGNRLVEVSGHSKCSKVMQCQVFIAAINYLHINEFVEVFKSIRWECPESVQLLIKDEHDDAFTVYTPDPPA